MAPEYPPSLVILDLRWEGRDLRGTLSYVETTDGSPLRVRWATEQVPRGFRPCGDGVCYVQDNENVIELPIDEHVRVPQIGERHYRWDEGLAPGVPWLMFVLIEPGHGGAMDYFQPPPKGVKLFQGRPALYWVLRGDNWNNTRVEWSQRGIYSDPPDERDLLRFLTVPGPPASNLEPDSNLTIDARRPLTKHSLHDFLGERLSLDELQTVTFRMGIDYENFPARKESFARELILHLDRAGKLAALATLLQERYPERWQHFFG